MLIWEIGDSESDLCRFQVEPKEIGDWNLKFNLSGFQVDAENILIQWNHVQTGSSQ